MRLVDHWILQRHGEAFGDVLGAEQPISPTCRPELEVPESQEIVEEPANRELQPQSIDCLQLEPFPVELLAVFVLERVPVHRAPIGAHRFARRPDRDIGKSRFEYHQSPHAVRVTGAPPCSHSGMGILAPGPPTDDARDRMVTTEEQQVTRLDSLPNLTIRESLCFHANCPRRAHRHRLGPPYYGGRGLGSSPAA